MKPQKYSVWFQAKKITILANHDEQLTAKSSAKKITLDESARLDLSLPSSWVESGFAPPTHNSPLKVVWAITFGTGLLDSNFKLCVVFFQWSILRSKEPQTGTPTQHQPHLSRLLSVVACFIQSWELCSQSGLRTEVLARPETLGMTEDTIANKF